MEQSHVARGPARGAALRAKPRSVQAAWRSAEGALPRWARVDKQLQATPSSAVVSQIRRTTMNDWQRETRADYHRKGFASRSGYGRSPALVIVDFIKGFTDPTTDRK